MEVSSWASEHWFDLLQTVGIVGGLFFTAYTSRKDEKARKIGYLIEINKHHQRIWKEFYDRPELSRVLKLDVDVVKNPISDAEGFFVNFVVLHLSTVYRAMEEGMFVPIEGLKTDVRNFFSLPIPRSIWDKSSALQNADFSRFVDTCLSVPNN